MGRLEGMILSIRKEIPQSQIIILHRYYQNEKDTFGNDLKNRYSNILFKPHPWFNENSSNFKTGFISLLHFIPNAINCKFFGRNILDKYDFIVDINFIEPDLLTSEYDIEAIIGNVFVLLNAWYASLSKKPAMVCSATIGPYESIFTKMLATSVLNKMDVITLRESTSMDYLSTIGVLNPQIHLSADLTFLLEASPNKDFPELYTPQNIKRPLIGIVPTAMMHPSLKLPDYIRLMSELIKTLVDDMNCSVLLITNTYQDKSITDQIYENAKNNENVKILPFHTSAPETKSAIGNCDMFICSRFHALVASTAMGVPSIGIVAYSYNKFHGIIGKMMGQEKYLIDIDNNFDYDIFLAELKLKIQALLMNSNQISDILTEKHKIMKDQCYFNGHLIKKYIDNKP